MKNVTHRVRVCVPVCVTRAGDLRAAVARAARVGDLVEVRFDCLEAGEEGAALAELGRLDGAAWPPLVYTFRPAEEGGRRTLSAGERLAFWEHVARGRTSGEAPPAFADVELSLFESPHGGALREITRGLDLICSHHDFGRVPPDLHALYERMKRTQARVCKIAALAHDATDCLPLLQLLAAARAEGRDLIAVAMGPAGILTRVLGPSRGSFMTYGAPEGGPATAPGQTTARDLSDLYRVRAIDDDTLITGLVGRPVAHSLSPHMHNAAFTASGVNGVYLPLEVADVEGFVRRMVRPCTREAEWRLRGLSVTSPHKSAVLPHLDRVDPCARAVGAVNTIVVEGAELRGYNTDAPAALAPLEERLELSGAPVAVVGAGGAARAVLWALRQRGARAFVFARDETRSRALAEEFGALAAPLACASFGGFAAVINATPLGTRGANESETPAVAAQLRGARLAYDLVYNPPETRFLGEARSAGCETVGGLQMLVAQAAAQFELWTGAHAPTGAMRAAAEKQLIDSKC